MAFYRRSGLSSVRDPPPEAPKMSCRQPLFDEHVWDVKEQSAELATGMAIS
jgi:hypothetical protein